MPANQGFAEYLPGRLTPRLGGPRPVSCLRLLLAFGLLLAGCGNNEEQRTLEPARVAMNESVEPIYDDGELTIYEVKAEFALPIAAPDQASQNALDEQDVEPYGAGPWVQNDQVEVQVSWVISNLDAETRNVRLIFDPWNEFGRYWPGVSVVDEESGEAAPNLSGYERLLEVPGTSVAGEARVHGVVTFDAMHELAVDFATVMSIIENPPPEDDPNQPYNAATLANHAFEIHNQSQDDLLVSAYIPEVIAGLTGFDFGLRTFDEPGNVALEIVVEVVDTGDQRVLERDSTDPVLEVPETQFTVP